MSVTTEYIINIINTLCSNKAHGYDGISGAMRKLCASEVAIPLQILFQDCINSGMFLQIVGNTPMFNLFIKKVTDRLKVIYRPISLLPICGKILEKIVFDQVYAFLNKNLLSKNQCGFRPGDSTIYQLLSITSTIYDAFENYDETRAVFLDIFKAFDKVWYEGVIYKLKYNGISGNLLNFFENYLLNRRPNISGSYF